MQASQKLAEGGGKASVSAVDLAETIADKAEPTAARLNKKIESTAHDISSNAEFHSNDVADEYQKGAKVSLLSICGCLRCSLLLLRSLACTFYYMPSLKIIIIILDGMA